MVTVLTGLYYWSLNHTTCMYVLRKKRGNAGVILHCILKFLFLLLQSLAFTPFSWNLRREVEHQSEGGESEYKTIYKTTSIPTML